MYKKGFLNKLSNLTMVPVWVGAGQSKFKNKNNYIYILAGAGSSVHRSHFIINIRLTKSE
jgi:hypothetical protein